MTTDTKLGMLKDILNIHDNLLDTKLSNYLDLSQQEILEWMFINRGGVPETIVSVPSRYEVTQIYAVVAGFNGEGGENETAVTENGIHREFHYTDMLHYIRSNVFQLV